MTQNLALVVWPALMVVSALIPVLMGLRDYRRLAIGQGEKESEARSA
jgi:hypothetical protein